MTALVLIVLASAPIQQRVVSFHVAPWFSNGAAIEVEQYSKDLTLSLGVFSGFSNRVVGDFGGPALSTGVEIKRFLRQTPLSFFSYSSSGEPYFSATVSIAISHLTKSFVAIGSVITALESINVGYRLFFISRFHLTAWAGIAATQSQYVSFLVQFNFGVSVGFAL